MRFPRVKAQGQGFYHVISRIVSGVFVFGTVGLRRIASEKFRSLMRRHAAFSGVQILDYSLMSNHFHLVCFVPEARPLYVDEVLERIGALYGSERVEKLRALQTRLAELPDGLEQFDRLLDPYRRRMNDLSIFIKELKGCFAQWYNRQYNRYGALWAERFKSVLLEGGQALAAVVAYVSLNPVRAGLCEDPKDYPYCGYAEAVARGTPEALEGIRIALGLPPAASTQELSREYRKLLFRRGSLGSKNKAPAFDMAKAQEVVEQEEGELSGQEQLHCKIRYFTDGVILGSRSFVEDHCHRLKQKLGYKRKSGPTACKLLGLWVFRNLRVRVRIRLIPAFCLQKKPAHADACIGIEDSRRRSNQCLIVSLVTALGSSRGRFSGNLRSWLKGPLQEIESLFFYAFRKVPRIIAGHPLLRTKSNSLKK